MVEDLRAVPKRTNITCRFPLLIWFPTMIDFIISFLLTCWDMHAHLGFYHTRLIIRPTTFSPKYLTTLLWSFSGIFPPTVFKVPFQLSYHGLVIWIHCKYEKGISPVSIVSLWLQTNRWFALRDISNNKISGSIPSSLGDLEHLLKLWVV